MSDSPLIHQSQWIEQVEEPATAEYFATINDGKIVVYTKATPPHTLLDCQIALTREEYDLLSVLNGRIDKAARIIRDIKAKVKSNGS